VIAPGLAKLGSREKMRQISAVNTLGAQVSPLSQHIPPDTRAGEREVVDEALFPSTASPGQSDLRIAVAAVLVSAAFFFAAVPFARHPLPPLWAFIPAYESALVLSDLVTAVLLFAQFSILRSRALLVLACAYLFTAFIVVAHALTFPGVFSTTGLLGAGPQSTAWLYMFWHGGFPLVVIAYALLKDDGSRSRVADWPVRPVVLVGIGAAFTVAAGLTVLATGGQALLPPMLDGNSFTTAMRVVVTIVWTLSFVALAVLWTRPRRSVIDLWLMVVMCAWLFDIALSAVLNASRFDLGWYAGRIYGLMAATFVLVVLLVTTARLYGRLAWLLGTEQQARRRESGLRQRIFDTSLDLILVCSRTGSLVQVSPSCQAILGYSPREMSGREASRFIFPEDLDNTRTEMRAARRGRQTRTFECRYVHKDGRAVPLTWTGVWSEPDQQHFFIGRDMSEHIKLEHQLRQAQKMEAIGQLTGGIAHDFNNILAVIIGMAELTAIGVASDPKLAAMVKQIDEAAERGAQLVQRMLAFARKQPLVSRVVDVNDAVKQAAAMLERTLGEDVDLQSALADDLWPAVADPSQLGNSIINLAVNARDAMPKGGRLVIETANVQLDEDYAAQNAEVRPGDYVAVIVSDSGTGITPEVIERVFEPFFTTKEVGKGTGLGLSMVYGFVKQSGGHVKVYSEVGHGTSIKLYFPRAVQKAPATHVPAFAATLPLGKETILVVEDDANVRGMAVSTLEGLGYQVRQACDGKSALDVLRSADHIDLLFTDMIMPNGYSGQDLVKIARQLRPRMKALLTSGYSEQFITMRGDGEERDVRLIGKPYRRDKLATEIRSALNDQQ
jgi:PAS domain S-box-containing protein